MGKSWQKCLSKQCKLQMIAYAFSIFKIFLNFSRLTPSDDFQCFFSIIYGFEYRSCEYLKYLVWCFRQIFFELKRNFSGPGRCLSACGLLQCCWQLLLKDSKVEQQFIFACLDLFVYQLVLPNLLHHLSYLWKSNLPGNLGWLAVLGSWTSWQE